MMLNEEVVTIIFERDIVIVLWLIYLKEEFLKNM
jgi:hypothetical protein